MAQTENEKRINAEQSRANLMEQGLYYLVSPQKRDAYADRALRQIAAGANQQPYLKQFVDETGVVAADLIDPGEKAIEGASIGATRAFLDAARKAQAQWLRVAHGFLSTPEGQNVFRQLMTPKDQQVSEFHEFVATPRPLKDGKAGQGYLNKGSLIRIDEMLTEDERLLACDPNLVPLGFAFNHGYSMEMFGPAKPDAKEPPMHELYPTRLGKLVGQNGNRLSGIVTGLNYPNWPSHVYTAEQVRRLTDTPFFAIPLEAVNPESGNVDSEKVADMYKQLGLKDADRIINQGEVTPGVVVRYSREMQAVHPETKVVNAPGFRVLESQIWNGLITLPGFKSMYRDLTGDTIDDMLHRSTNIPTLIGRISESGIDVAHLMDKTGHISWIPMDESYGQLDYLQRFIETTDRAGELAWFVKTFSTSGKKGVRLTNGGRFEKAEKNIAKVVGQLGIKEGSFLIQPKVHSAARIEQPDGSTDKERLKVDLFLSGDDLAVAGMDAMTTPIHQRSSHGGSQTKFNVVKV